MKPDEKLAVIVGDMKRFGQWTEKVGSMDRIPECSSIRGPTPLRDTYIGHMIYIYNPFMVHFAEGREG
jgi:hypothetical protein